MVVKKTTRCPVLLVVNPQVRSACYSPYRTSGQGVVGSPYLEIMGSHINTADVLTVCAYAQFPGWENMLVSSLPYFTLCTPSQLHQNPSISPQSRTNSTYKAKPVGKRYREIGSEEGAADKINQAPERTVHLNHDAESPPPSGNAG